MKVRSPVPLRIRKGLEKHFPASKRLKELEANVVRNLNKARGKRDDDGPATPFLIPDEVRERLVLAVADDVSRLRTFMDSDFEGWHIA